jgi:hypothetical protein
MCRTLSDPVATLQYATPVPISYVSTAMLPDNKTLPTCHPKVDGYNQIRSELEFFHGESMRRKDGQCLVCCNYILDSIAFRSLSNKRVSLSSVCRIWT